nr:hypothetical protein CFP56_49363 [Quercus suber]
MDTMDFTEELAHFPHTKLSPITQVINSIPNSPPSHIRPQDFENQIEDIDLALKKFDFHTPPIFNKPTVTLTHADPFGDKSGEIKDIQGDMANTHPRIEAQVVPSFEDMKVSALIDPTTRKWDLNMLYGLFTDQEIELISSIPLCPNAVEDVVVSPFTPQTQAFSSISEVLMYTDNERKNLELLASIMWSLWHRRNQVRTSPKDYPLSQVASTASQVLADFERANSNDAMQTRNFSQARQQWSSPQEGNASF